MYINDDESVDPIYRAKHLVQLLDMSEDHLVKSMRLCKQLILVEQNAEPMDIKFLIDLRYTYTQLGSILLAKRIEARKSRNNLDDV